MQGLLVALRCFKEDGLKLIPRRKSTADAFHDANADPTAEEIIDRVQTRMPEVQWKQTPLGGPMNFFALEMRQIAGTTNCTMISG